MVIVIGQLPLTAFAKSNFFHSFYFAIDYSALKMAAFSSHHHPIILDTPFLSNPSSTNANTMFSSSPDEEVDAPCFSHSTANAPHEISFADTSHRTIYFCSNSPHISHVVDKLQKQESQTNMGSSSLGVEEFLAPNLMEDEISGSCFSYIPPSSLPLLEVLTKTLESSSSGNKSLPLVEKQNQETSNLVKRSKNRNGCCLISCQAQEGKDKKQKKGRSSLKEAEEIKKPKIEKSQKKTSEEPPSGFIHVRARRGEATDSHSLAERLRREKISERMKVLQGLVPGCDKVTGKAMMLDEIINYVQSLQKQIEFLARKLASLNRMFFNLGVELDDYMPDSAVTEILASMEENFRYQATAVAIPTNSTRVFSTTNNLTLPENDASVPLQGLNVFSEDNGRLAWDVGDQEKILDQPGYPSTYTFQ